MPTQELKPGVIFKGGFIDILAISYIKMQFICNSKRRSMNPMNLKSTKNWS